MKNKSEVFKGMRTFQEKNRQFNRQIQEKTGFENVTSARWKRLYKKVEHYKGWYSAKIGDPEYYEEINDTLDNLKALHVVLCQYKNDNRTKEMYNFMSGLR